MSIRLKLILCILLSVILLTGVLYGIATTVIFKSYLSIEKSLNTQNIVRVEQTLENYNMSLAVKLRDWSHWDDSYMFANDGNQAFIDANLQNTSLETLEINSMIFLNTNENIVYAKNIDLTTGEDFANSTLTSEILIHKKITDEDESGEAGGIIQTNQGLLLVEALPILHNDGQGPVNGTIIFSRLLDDELLQKTSDLTQLELHLFTYDDTNLPEDVAYAKDVFPLNQTHLLIPQTSDTMAGYILLKDIDGQPVGIVRITMPRDIYGQGQTTLTTFILISSFCILLFGAVIILLVNRLLFVRLQKLNDEILKINSDSDETVAKVTEGAQDEMGKVARKINDMLHGLFTAQKNEREAHRLKLEAATLLQQQQKDAENMSRIMVEREIKMNELNKEIAALKDKVKL